MSQEFISIPVPRERVQEVYELLARPKAEAPAQGSSSSGDPREQSEQRDLVIRIYRESPDTMKVMLRVLADRAGKIVPMETVAKEVGRQPRQMAGALGAFGRRFKHRYEKVAPQWPFEAWWDFERNTMVYRMSQRVAEVVKSLDR